ncbi:MAG: hypothetical protein LWY06_00840 [Firmicutes bacterium]|nr:hypothetical protein [Bacillota bacterium]
MEITRNIVKDLLFQFVILEYNNKVKYGQPPTPLVHFYNNWLISALMKHGFITDTEDSVQAKELYADKFLEITWLSVEDLLRDRIIKRRLISSEDLLHQDLYVPTEKGLEIWEKYGKLLIIPSNLIDSLKQVIPEIDRDVSIVFDYLNEAVDCYFHNLQLSCCLCMASAAEKAVLSFTFSLARLLKDGLWEKSLKTTPGILPRIDSLKEKLKNLIKTGALAKDYYLVYAKPDDYFRDDLESFLRSLDLITTIITLTRKEDDSPSSAISTIDETFRQDLILGYLTGSYTFFRLNFVLKEIIDNISDFKEK